MFVLSHRPLLWGCVFVVACSLFTGCKSPREQGLQALENAGIEASGRSLTDSVIKGDAATVKWLLDAQVLTEVCDARGKTALRIAVETHRDDLVKLLIAHGADVNATTADDQISVLSHAAEQGATENFESLLKAGARPEGCVSDGERLLPWAIREGRLAYVRSMIAAGADPHTTDRQGNSLLHIALKTGRRGITESLLDHGANPGELSARGANAILLAIQQGWYDLLPKLAQRGADPNLRCFAGKTPLEQAVVTKDNGLLASMLNAGADVNLISPVTGRTVLELAVAENDPAIFSEFLKHGCRPADGYWERFLWLSLENRNLKMVRLLLMAGAQGDSHNRFGRLPIEAAVLANTGDLVKLLADFGCPQGKALLLASSQGNRFMVNLLVSCGASVDGILVPGVDSPLSLALRSQQDSTAMELLNLGAESQITPDGQSLFLLAIATGCHETVHELLKRGANPNMPIAQPVSDSLLRSIRRGDVRWALRNDTNVTPLMVAVDSGALETARHLLRAGAKVSVRTRKAQLWPITIAAERNDVKMTRLLLGKDPQREQRHIVIRLSEQKARLYDASGAEIFVTSISSGRKGYSTPTGEFVITDKNREWTSTLYHASMPFFQRLSCKDFGLHQGVVPGYPASHGCIRVPAGNAAKLFAMTDTGDRVRIEP